MITAITISLVNDLPATMAISKLILFGCITLAVYQDIALIRWLWK